VGASKANAFAAASQDTDLALEIGHLLESEYLVSRSEVVSWSAEVLHEGFLDCFHLGLTVAL
jgi:hypothetical protein